MSSFEQDITKVTKQLPEERRGRGEVMGGGKGVSISITATTIVSEEEETLSTILNMSKGNHQNNKYK